MPRATAAPALLDPMAVSVIAAVLAMPSSIIGNEAAIRFGRHRAIVLFMSIAGIVAVLIGAATATAAPVVLLALLFVYAIAIPADSGALTSGMTLSAQPEYRGATMAMHSTIGFGLSAAGGLGHRRGARCGRRHGNLERLARCVSRDGCRWTCRSDCHLVVATQPDGTAARLTWGSWAPQVLVGSEPVNLLSKHSVSEIEPATDLAPTRSA